jgi:hypothetical protein
MTETAFRITDTQDGRFAVEDEKGFVLEGLTKNQADRLKAYLGKMKGEIDKLKPQQEAVKTPDAIELMDLATKHNLKK